jgi:hypothetical protein
MKRADRVWFVVDEQRLEAQYELQRIAIGSVVHVLKMEGGDLVCLLKSDPP